MALRRISSSIKQTSYTPGFKLEMSMLFCSCGENFPLHFSVPEISNTDHERIFGAPECSRCSILASKRKMSPSCFSNKFIASIVWQYNARERQKFKHFDQCCIDLDQFAQRCRRIKNVLLSGQFWQDVLRERLFF